MYRLSWILAITNMLFFASAFSSCAWADAPMFLAFEVGRQDIIYPPEFWKEEPTAQAKEEVHKSTEIWRKINDARDRSHNDIAVIQGFTELISLGSADGEIYCKDRGALYFKLGKYRLAIDDFRRALSHTTSTEQKSEIHLMRARAYEAIKQYKAAIVDCNLCGEPFSWEQPSAYTVRSECYEALGDRKRAIEDAEEAYSLALEVTFGDAKAEKDRLAKLLQHEPTKPVSNRRHVSEFLRTIQAFDKAPKPFNPEWVAKVTGEPLTEVPIYHHPGKHSNTFEWKTDHLGQLWRCRINEHSTTERNFMMLFLDAHICKISFDDLQQAFHTKSELHPGSRRERGPYAYFKRPWGWVYVVFLGRDKDAFLFDFWTPNDSHT